MQNITYYKLCIRELIIIKLIDYLVFFGETARGAIF